MRLRQGQEVDGPSQLGRRLDCLLFDRRSQHRGSVPGVASDSAHDADARVHQIIPWPGLHAKPGQGAGRQDARRSERGSAAKRVAAGEVGVGFQTPSRAFGLDYIFSFDGVTRDDLNC